MTDRRPARSGANTAARQLAEFLRAHAAREDELLGEYQRLCVELPSPALRYLARLIQSDEERHQMIFGDLAETVYASDDLKASGMPILDGPRVIDPVVRQRTLEVLQRFIEREEEEHGDLVALIATLAPGEQSALWSVLIDFIAQDTKRHLDLLEFMRTQMLRSAA
jgi:rubrerythrin